MFFGHDQTNSTQIYTLESQAEPVGMQTTAQQLSAKRWHAVMCLFAIRILLW